MSTVSFHDTFSVVLETLTKELNERPDVVAFNMMLQLLEESAENSDCPTCEKPIRNDEIIIVIPEDCDVDVGYCGRFHFDCGILELLGDNVALYEETVTKLFDILRTSSSEWKGVDTDLETHLFSHLRAEMAKLDSELAGWLAPNESEVQR